MCIRDSVYGLLVSVDYPDAVTGGLRRTTDMLRGVLERTRGCLLYTSDAADERSSVDLGGRRIIKKKNRMHIRITHVSHQHDSK